MGIFSDIFIWPKNLVIWYLANKLNTQSILDIDNILLVFNFYFHDIFFFLRINCGSHRGGRCVWNNVRGVSSCPTKFEASYRIWSCQRVPRGCGGRVDKRLYLSYVSILEIFQINNNHPRMLNKEPEKDLKNSCVWFFLFENKLAFALKSPDTVCIQVYIYKKIKK